MPNRVWLGLPDPAKCTDAAAFQAALRGMGAVLLSGLSELSSGEMRQLAHLCMYAYADIYAYVYIHT